jgi:hypothetical protein
VKLEKVLLPHDFPSLRSILKNAEPKFSKSTRVEMPPEEYENRAVDVIVINFFE